MKHTIKSDRELDALVAEHIFGWANIEQYLKGVNLNMGVCLNFALHEWIGVYDGKSNVIPHYSSDGNAMLEVLEKLDAKYIEIQNFWVVFIKKCDLSDKVCSHDASLPKAVCLAVLKSKGIEVEYE